MRSCTVPVWKVLSSALRKASLSGGFSQHPRGMCTTPSVLSARGQSLDKKGLKVCQRAGSRANGWSLRGSGLKSSPGMIQRPTGKNPWGPEVCPRNSVPVVCFLSLGKTSLLRFFLLIVVTYLSYRNGLVSFLLSDFSTAFSLPLSPTHPIFLTVSSLLQLECVHL